VTKLFRKKPTIRVSLTVMVLSLVTWIIVPLLATGHWQLATFLRTPDQSGYGYFQGDDYEKAADCFTDPQWQGVALFKQGQFKAAAGLFAGYDTAQAVFNHGNALLMQGKYEDAARRYARALELRPDWEAATVNQEIALARAKLLKKEGGDMTGGEMGADEIVFSEGKAPPSAGEEQVEGGQEMDDAALRAMWLRRVQTKPADFLRAKFAYQHARAQRE
jgi:Ca-activated chloride channel family protein